MQDIDDINNFFEVMGKFSQENTNIYVRTVLNFNLLMKDHYYFGKRPLIDFLQCIITEDISKKMAKNKEDVSEFYERCPMLFQNMIVKVVKGEYAFHAKLNKSAFLELSFLLHESSKIDELLELKHKPFLLFFFQFVLFFNAKKLELNFSLSLLSQFEYAWNWIWLSDVYSSRIKNMRP